MKDGEGLTEQKKAELRLIADLTYEGALAALEKISKLKAEQAAQATD